MVDEHLRKSLELLTKMSKLELALSALYRACKERWPDDWAFWEGVEYEELEHVRYVREMKELVERRPDEFALNASFVPAAIDVLIGRTEDLTRSVRSGTYDLVAAAADAVDLEDSLLERNLPELLLTENTAYLASKNRIVSETTAHRAKLQDKLDTLKGRK